MIESVIENSLLYITLILMKKEETYPNCKSVDIIVDSYRSKEINHPMLSGMDCIIRYRCRR